MLPATLKAKGVLALTLKLDSATQTFLTRLRARYFPSQRNHLDAHVALFRAIPPQRLHEVDRELDRICQTQPPYQVLAHKPWQEGSKRPAKVDLRQRPHTFKQGIQRDLQEFLCRGAKEPADELTDLDLRPPSRPHVTIMDKGPETKRRLVKCHKEIAAVFAGMPTKWGRDREGQLEGEAIGLEL